MRNSITKLGRLKRYTTVPGLYILRSSEHMTRIILTGTFVVGFLLIALLLFSLIVLGHTYMTEQAVAGLVLVMYLGIVSFLVYRKNVRAGAWMLVILYGLLGIFILHTWGINAPTGVLILGFVILITNVMLGTKHILIVTSGIIMSLIVLQYFSAIGLHSPDRSSLDDTSSFGDVLGYSVIFSLIAVIAWLSGTKMEHALERAIHAESELQKEKDDLITKVEYQTQRLKDAQHKELKQLYKFAELGQLTTIILHELANYLSVLTLDIDDIEERHQNSIAIEHAKESIFYIDTIIDQVRNQIKDSDNTQKFDALEATQQSVEHLKTKIRESNIKLFVEDGASKNYYIFGDPLRLSQAITILVTNAAQANKNKQSQISIEISSTKSKIVISVKDFGTGITDEARRTLFQPQKSSKGSGMGIGLFVTKQIIETHFKGKIRLSPATEYTQFTIEIPRLRR